MPLKKDAPPEVKDEAGNAPAPSAQAPAAAPPAAAEKAQPKKEKSVVLLAVHRPLSDPFTGVPYTLSVPKPAIVSDGNWVDCQMKAGLLKVYTAPVEPEEE